VFTARFELNPLVEVRLIFMFKSHAMAVAVSRRPLTAEAWLRSRAIYQIFGGPQGTATGFPPSIAGFPPQYVLQILHTHLHLHVSLT
jgi:hypothetical protein